MTLLTRLSGLGGQGFLCTDRISLYLLERTPRGPEGVSCLSTRLERIANGDESAVSEILDEYSGLVWRLANRYLDRAKGEIDDAIQDVFVEIWLSAKRYDRTKGSEAAFIATVAHRRLIDHQRRVVSRRKVSRAQEVQAKISDSPITPIRAAVHRQVAIEIAGKFDELPDEERQALWLAVHRGMTHRQISDVTESPIGTVKSRLRRGLIKLARKASDETQETGESSKGGVA